MTATISEIRDGLKTRLATISTLANRSYDVWPDRLEAPAALVTPETMGYQEAMGGKRLRTFAIVLLAAPIQRGLVRAQDALDAYLDDTGANSIIAALDGDMTLGGIVTTLNARWSDYSSMEVPPGSSIEYLGVRFEVAIWA